MRHALAILSLLVALGLSLSAKAQTPGPGLPIGELAKGSIQPVPEGDLVISVAEGGINGMGGQTRVGGLPGFLMSMGEGPGFNVQGSNKYHLDRWGAIFLPGNLVYTLDTGGDWGDNFRFIGFGKGIKNDFPHGTVFYSEPVPWGPGADMVYDVTLRREAFPAGSMTPWYRHSGPVFGLFESGSWENRQANGVTIRTPAPGYYVQSAGGINQIAQVDANGGYELLVEFSPPGEPATVTEPVPSDRTPTETLSATPLPGLSPEATLVPPLPTWTPVASSAQTDIQPTSISDTSASPALITPTDKGAGAVLDWWVGWVILVLAIGFVFAGLFLFIRRRR
jgi:hypothetical protein